MNRFSRGVAGWLAAFVAAAACSTPSVASGPAEPEIPAERGPFEERNQFPFNLPFLAFPARGGRTLPRGEVELLVSQTYSNTFVGSAIFFDDFDPLSDARQRLSPDVVARAQLQEPGRSLFFVDTEQGRTEIRCRAGIGSRLEAGMEVPFLSYRGGAFDPFIEDYHRNMNLADGGREIYVQNLSELALTLGNDSFFAGESPGLYQLGDLSFYGRIQAIRSPPSDLAFTTAVKLPTGDPDRLGGSGGVDYGIEVEGTLRRGRHRIHYGAGWVWTGEWSPFPGFHPADMGNLTAAYEFVHRPSLSWILQLQAQSSVFRGAPGADADLLQPSTEILGGVKGSLGSGWSFEAGLIENIFNQNNGVDVGLRAGIAYRFRSR